MTVVGAIGILLGLASFLGLSIGVISWLSWTHDRRVFAEVADQIRARASSIEEQIARATHWVYEKEGFAKNRGYFLHPGLGPTPMDVYQRGGDCADKSRLLVAILAELGIRSTMVMLYNRAGGDPTHTVVDARIVSGTMAADPVFDIVFPKPDGGFYGVAELRDDPGILIERLDALVAERGEDAKIARYKRDTESYRWPKTINWDKNALTRGVERFIRVFGSKSVFIGRPRALEDPKLLVTLSGMSMGLIGLLLGCALVVV